MWKYFDVTFFKYKCQTFIGSMVNIKQNMFRFWTIGWIKQRINKICHVGLSFLVQTVNP